MSMRGVLNVKTVNKTPSASKDKNATALAFVGIRLLENKKLVYGAGSHPDIARTAVAALVSALNCAVCEG